MKITKILDQAVPPLDEVVGIAEVDGDVHGNGVIVDIKLLKHALVYIQNTNKNVLSIRITTATHYGDIPFLVITTQEQEEQTDKKVVYVISPLTGHVDKAEKFEDIPREVFLSDIISEQMKSENKPSWLYVEE